MLRLHLMHSTDAQMLAVVTNKVAWSVCMSDCVMVTNVVRPAKTGKPIKMSSNEKLAWDRRTM